MTGLVVRYDGAKRQWDQEQEAARHAREGAGGDGEKAAIAPGKAAPVARDWRWRDDEHGHAL